MLMVISGVPIFIRRSSMLTALAADWWPDLFGTIIWHTAIVISATLIISRLGALKVGIPIPHLLFGSACFRIQLSVRLSRCAIRL